MQFKVGLIKWNLGAAMKKMVSRWQIVKYASDVGLTTTMTYKHGSLTR